jgi:serine/threonine protein kinase
MEYDSVAVARFSHYGSEGDSAFPETFAVNELDIFSKALELADPEARGRYLHQTCGADSALRQRIEALLRNAEETSRFLETPAIVAALGTEAATGDPEPSAGAEARPDAGSPNLDFLSPADDPAALGCLGPYVVTEVVGSGGMGIVLKACDESLHRVVALKVLAPELSTNPTARKRFLREGKSAAAVVHQHVVTIHAVAEDRLPYIVMEFVHGPSLQAKIDAEGHLNLNETLRIGAQIAAGLAAAHAQGVIHRDIKPSNILLENGIERVRISDFGLARAVDDVEITRPGEVAGTPQYMSPEQAQGQPVDARSDLFSFGCVLYAMCTGRPPFRAETTIEAIRRVCDEAPRPIREINPDVPEWLAEIDSWPNFPATASKPRRKF